ncbi:trans-sulfuration enzyme family protein [Ekhidna sp. To15]|uniref:trans-sulfuration enzyme family protein n=1 Tax=Ekhidna sp. To15 TaxID=3395267 RepID=UPI003F51D941
MKNSSGNLGIASWLVSAGRENEVGKSLNIPPILASNYILGDEFAYARNEGTQAWSALEEIIGGLEHGEAVVFSSGMAAISAVFNQVKTGSTIVIPDDCYQGVASLANEGEQKGIWSVEKVAVKDTDGWLKALEYADLIWLESPSNPLLEIADLRKICSTKRKAGSILGVDNTFATHINQQPLDLGADVSVQSATKFIGGHSDLLSGVASTNNPKLLEQLRKSRELIGATPGAMEVFLALRGIRTMHLRLERAQQNAMELARRLQQNSNVAHVRYPGLTNHPSHAIAKEQLNGFGTIISFDTVGDSATADSVCHQVKLILHATSLGAVESTIERRAAISGQSHLPETLLRLSVGVEGVEDLWDDLNQALQKAVG